MLRRKNGLSMAYFLLGISLPLSVCGCAHKDGVETARDWWHDFEGGDIARLRPPPPGQDAPYPSIGRTPTDAPDLPSSAAREVLTRQLEADRNLAQRETASHGPLPLLPRPSRRAATPSASFASGNATMTAPEGAPPARHDVLSPMPAVVADTAASSASRTLPDMGQAPPPLSFPGFATPAIPTSSRIDRPDLDLATPRGTLIRFQPASNRALGASGGIYHRLASQRGRQRINVLGFGATMGAEAGLSPADQAREIALGLLRAQNVAQGLEDEGVPASMIDLQAAAIGDGVRVRIGD